MLTPVSDSPFAVLTLIAAPAVFTNASSVLALGTGNRLARVVDRTRALVKELHSADIDPATRALWVSHLGRLEKRGALLVRAMSFLLRRNWLFRGGQRRLHSGRQRGIHKIQMAI
jgi:hypothetical protein